MLGGRDLRSEFPTLHQSVGGRALVYLDNAATTHKPRAVIDALTRYYEKDNSNVHRGLHALSMRATDGYEAARVRTAQFIGAEHPAEIIFTRGTTESINLVAQSWGAANLRKDDVILLTEMEHHSNLVPWQVTAERTGARVKYVPILGSNAEGGLDLAALDNLLTPQVKLFAFTHISNTLGVINPVAELCRRARAVGALTLVDAAQSIGHEPVDVRAIGCDFLAFSGHKMAGPTGIGVLYGRRALLDAMPPWQTGGGMISQVEFTGTSFIVSLGIGSIGSMMSFILVRSVTLAQVIPWSLPFNALEPYIKQGSSLELPLLVSLAGTFIFTLFGLWDLSTKDII